MADKQYTIKVGYSVDDAGLNKVKADLKTVQEVAQNLKLFGKGDYTREINALSNAFDKSANFSLNKFDTGKFVNEIKKGKVTVDQLRTSLNAMGSSGRSVFNHLAKDILDTNIQLNQTPKFIKEFQRTFTNVFRYNIAGTIQNAFAGSFQQAIGFAKSLDSSLNDIRIVTGKSADEMARFSKEAASAAKSLGKSTTDYANASLIYYQQGLDEKEVKARTETTLKAANVTGQGTDEVSQELTAVWNGYKLVADQTEEAVDKLAAVAATTASNLEELSTGMSKVASAANTMGVDFDQLNAQIATIISVTRQAPESVGTALKTIYARMSTIQAGGMDEEGNTLTSYTEKMNDFGISVLDQAGNLRNMGDVMEEIGQKWQYMNKEQQVSLAQAMAGTRQYNNLMALFENWDMYNSALKTSENALGTLQKQQDIYMDSIEAHINKLETAKEEVFNTLIDADSFKDLIDTVTTLTETLNTFFETFGGGLNGIMALMGMIAPMFKNQLTNGFISTTKNIKDIFTNKNLMQAQVSAAREKQTQFIDQDNLGEAMAFNGTIGGMQAIDKHHGLTFLTQEEYDSIMAESRTIGESARSAANGRERLFSAMSEHGAFHGVADDYEDYFLKDATIDPKRYDILKESIEESYDLKGAVLADELGDVYNKVIEDEDFADLKRFTKIQTGRYEAKKAGLNYDLSGDQKQLFRKMSKKSAEDYGMSSSAFQNVLNGEVDGRTINGLNDLINKQKEIQQRYEQLQEELRQLNRDHREYIDVIDEQQQKEESIVEAQQNQEKSIADKEAERLGPQMAIQAVTTGIQGMITAYSSIVSLNKIWSDETADVSDQLLQTGAILTLQILPSIMSTAKVIKDFKQSGGALSGIASFLSNPVTLGVAVGTAAIAGIITAVHNSEMQRLEKKAEEAKKNLQKGLDTAKESEKEAEALEQIEAGYDELQRQYEDGSMSKQDVINKTYDLCMQYGQEDLAVRALCGSYEELNGLIEENAKAKNDKAIKDSKAAVNLAIASAKAEVNKYNEKDWFDSNLSKSEITKIAKDYDRIQELIANNPNSADARYYNERLSVYGSQVETIRSQWDTQAQNMISNIGMGIDDGTITSQSAYIDAIEKAWNSNESDFSSIGYDKNQFVEELNNTLLSDEELSSYAQKANLASQIADETSGSVDEISNTIADLDTGAIMHITEALNDGIITSKDAFDDILDEYDAFRGYFEKNPVRLGVEGGLAQLAEKGEIDSATLAQIFSNGDVSGLSQEQFSGLDIGSQSVALLNANISGAQEMEQAKQEALKAAEAQRSELQQQWNDNVGEITQTVSAEDMRKAEADRIFSDKRVLLNADTQTALEIKAADEKQIEQIADAVINNKIDTLTKTQKIIVEKLSKEQDINAWAERMTNDYKVSSKGGLLHSDQKEIRELENRLNHLQKTINKLQKTEFDYKKNKDAVNNAYKQNGAIVDHLQSQYKNLTNVVKDYNDNGKLSVDNVQTLLTMDNAFVASLEFQGDQLAINGQAYESLMDIQKAYMKNEVLSQMITDLNGLSQQKAVDLSQQLGSAQVQLSFDIEKASAAAQQGTVAFTEYASALAKATGLDLGNISKDEAEIMKAAENKLKMIDAMTYYEDENSKSKKKKEEKKEYDDEFDRYWDLKKAIDKVTQALERLDEVQEHLHGPELIKSLQNENRLLEKQKETYIALGKEQEKEAAELRETLGDSGFLFDSEGQITNYKAQTQQMLQDMQAITDKFNQGGYDEESYDAAQKKYEKLKKNLERYDTLFYSEMVENEKKLREIEDEVIDNNMQAWETDIQVNLDLSEAERQWNDFFRDIQRDFTLEFEDISKKNAVGKKDFDTYTRAGGTLDTNMRAIQDIEAEMDTIMAGGAGKTIHSIAEGREKLKELASEYRDNIQNVYALYEEAWNNYLETIDQGSAKLEKLVKEYDLINQKLEFQSQLIQLIYGKQEYDLMDQFYTAQRVNSEQEVDSLRQQTEMWKKLYEEADEGSQDKAKYYDLWIDKQNQLNDLVIKHIEMLKNEYSNTVESIFNKLEKTMTNNNTFSWMKEQWDLAKKSADGYYDDVERIYELETMENKWKEAIDKADSNKSQKMLNELMNTQLDSLREKEKLSEYDITLAEKRLAVAKAQAALDDAQNAKNTMKVTRGTDGNWSYQYVADEDDVLAKQQALLDAQHEAYEFAKKSWEDMQASIISDTSEALESIKKLELEKVGASEEEIALIDEKIRTIEETYWGPEGIITQHKQMAAEQERMLNEETAMSLVTAYSVDKEAYAEMTAEEKALLDELRQNQIDSMQDVYYSTDEVYNLLADEAEATNARSLESWTTLSAEIIRQWNSDDEDSVRTNILSALGQCQDALVDYGTFLDILAEKAGMDFGESGISGQIAEATLRTELLNDQTAILVETIESDLANALEVFENMQDEWMNVAEDTHTAYEELENYLHMVGTVREELAELAQIINEMQNLDIDLALSVPKSTKGNPSDNPILNTNEDNGKGIYKLENYREGQMGLWDVQKGNWVTIGNESISKYLLGAAGYSSREDFANSNHKNWGAMSLQEQLDIYMQNRSLNNGNVVEQFLAKIAQKIGDAAQGLATGGYTGSWGSEGKLAVLHEKELVLNKEDTSNMLSLVDILRGISKSDVEGMMQLAFADGIVGTAGFGAITNSSSSVGGNTFNITAEFPNANDVNEIRQAILSLPNLAAQYINKK